MSDAGDPGPGGPAKGAAPLGGGGGDDALSAFGSARAFRTVLDALSRPGTVRVFAEPPAAPAPLSPAAAETLRVLSDADAPRWMSASRRSDAIDAYLRFHTSSAAAATPDAAAFACGPWAEIAEEALAALPVGSPEYPDRSATLIVETTALSEEALAGGSGAVLRGPGVDGETRLWAAGLSPEFWRWAQENAARFPLGLDMVMTAGDQIAGLPRSTVVEPL